jgi:NAD(P)-dependent dehydrogenase (short-subunit alcohol dehydrogenase family)
MVAETVKQFGTVDIQVKQRWNRIGAAAAEGPLRGAMGPDAGSEAERLFLCCQAVIPTMMKQGKGRIINIGSLAGRRMTFFGSAD